MTGSTAKRLLFLLPVLLFLALAGVMAFYMLSGRDPGLLPSTLIDKPAPQFSLPAIAGWNRSPPGLANKDLPGKVTVVNFFASWCVPCRVEHPQITELSRDKEIQVFGINYKDKSGAASAWLTRYANPYARIGADLNGRVGIDFGVYGMPETFILDRTGRIRFKHVGPILPRHMKEKILPVIRELKK
ncbi:MAG: DsbE family thiol:disulfide interchange protein [Alphaproteobacteria bacterium]|nr:DsbE family thiol:disulfide interchange protein [Alphaproteobacteria bacterium]